MPFRPEAGQADEQLGRQLWAGVPGVDYTEATRWKTPLNSDNLTVVHDKTATINPNSPRPDEFASYGKNMQRKMWHPVNRSLEYGDKERGKMCCQVRGCLTSHGRGICTFWTYFLRVTREMKVRYLGRGI